jgi:dihydroxyacetone kinase-like predicted kinase
VRSIRKSSSRIHRSLQRALTFGSLSKIKIDNMREEHQEKLIKDSQKLAAQQKAEEEAYEAAQADEKTNNMPAKEMGFVSVSIGEGMNEVFRGLGVDYLIEGGQTMNPSTEDMLNAIEHVNAKTVFILPNNKNIIMAANQAVDLVEDKQIIVIPTKTIPQGITALVNYIPDHSAEENKEQMMAEIENVKTGQVTYAVRDTEIDGKTIKQNDFMGIGDKSILSVGTDLKATTLEMVDAMVDEESAIVSIYFGSDSDEDSANELAAAIEEKYPDVEVEVNDGGQPIYYYVISVE